MSCCELGTVDGGNRVAVFGHVGGIYHCLPLQGQILESCGHSLLEHLSGICYRFCVEASDWREAIVRGVFELIQGDSLNFGQSLWWTNWSSCENHPWNSAIYQCEAKALPSDPDHLTR
jgi:hypothetical protein